MRRRLCKSSYDRWMFGVCGGIAEYFGLDAALVRIVWLIAALFFGTGVLMYFVLFILMPSDDRYDDDRY
ncbi:PspC domain-containing protein [Numidum massiliense]|uniref:PspC domain-containing protein n=1 Tax=Numidum massiliense TaxID=1522315 RepID=UPI0006D55C00|nr:PspC domain-containing protein [Numidum massiliense]